MRAIDEHDEVFTLEEFIQSVKTDQICDDDGCGYYATHMRMSDKEAKPSDISMDLIDKRFPNVVWISK